MALTFTVPGLDEATAQQVIDILQGRLRAATRTAMLLKHAHWNVAGQNFIAVHEMFDPEVDAVRGFVDELAERIATLGGSPDGRPEALADGSADTGNGTEGAKFELTGRRSTMDYLKAMDDYYTQLILAERKAIAQLDELDVISSNIVQDHDQEFEHFQWFMRSHLVQGQEFSITPKDDLVKAAHEE